jgi:hypothetical protein
MNGPEDPLPTTPVEEPAPTVELVSFGPTVTLGEAPPPNPEDAAFLRRRFILRCLAVLAVIAVVSLLIFTGPDFYRSLKAWRADSLARTGEAQLENQHVDEAVATIRAAFMMSPNEPEVLRAMAKTLTALDVPGAMAYWHWILESNEATDDDRRGAAECALRQGMHSQAAAIIHELLVKHPEDAQNLLMAGRLYAMSGNDNQAMIYATRATFNDPTSKPAAIFLALQEIKNPYLRQAGIDALMKLGDSDDIFGVLALQRVADEPNLKPEEVDHVIARLKTHPLAAEMQRITVLALEIKKNPAQRDALLKAAMAAHQGASVEDLQQFAVWLNTNGESERVLAILPRDQALTTKGLFKAYIDALGILKRWGDLEAVLTKDKVPLEGPFVQLYLARCAHEEGDEKASNLYWRQAQIAAAHNPKQSILLALYAEKMGQNERAESIYLLLTDEPLVSRIAFLGLLRLNESKDTRTIRDLLDQMATRWPNDPSIQNDDIYLNLLLNEKVPEMYQRTAELLKGDPLSLSYRTYLALSYLRLKKPEDALKVFRNSKIDWTKAPVSSVVVYAASLEGNGEHREARHAALALHRLTLRPEEQALIKSIR